MGLIELIFWIALFTTSTLVVDRICCMVENLCGVEDDEEDNNISV